MEISKHLKCVRCPATAHEYKGLEGGIYIGAGVNYYCYGKTKHKFVAQRTVKPKKRIRYRQTFYRVGSFTLG